VTEAQNSATVVFIDSIYRTVTTVNFMAFYIYNLVILLSRNRENAHETATTKTKSEANHNLRRRVNYVSM